MFDAPLETKRLAYTGSRLPSTGRAGRLLLAGGRGCAAATISDDSAPGALRFTVRHETEANGSASRAARRSTCENCWSRSAIRRRVSCAS